MGDRTSGGGSRGRSAGAAGAFFKGLSSARGERCAVAWIVLVVSGCMEAVWATALGKSDGFHRFGPTAVFAIGVVLSMAGLAYALRTLPVGTGYAVWVGIGAVVTVGYGMVFDGEAVSAGKVLLLAGIVGCVIGLKILH
jgi:quaternary ammonium compound-resistance protein SugE